MITYENLIAWRACYSDDRLRNLFADPLTVRQVLTKMDKGWDTVLPQDRLWVVLRESVLDAKILRLFACDVADEALKLIDNPDPRSIEAIRVSRLYAAGEATLEQLDAAADAASAAFAARAASASADAAADAAAAATAADAAATAAADAAAAASAAASAAAYAAAAAASTEAASRAAAAAASAASRTAATAAAAAAAAAAAGAAAGAGAAGARAAASRAAAAGQKQIDILLGLLNV